MSRSWFAISWGTPLLDHRFIQNDHYCLVWYGVTIGRRWALGLIQQRLVKGGTE